MKQIFFVLLVTFISTVAHAQDDRLLGNWVPTGLPFTAPTGLSFAIIKEGSDFIARPSTAQPIPAPVNCMAQTTDTLVRLTPASSTAYSATFSFYVPNICVVAPVATKAVTVSFSADAASFMACDISSKCST